MTRRGFFRILGGLVLAGLGLLTGRKPRRWAWQHIDAGVPVREFLDNRRYLIMDPDGTLYFRPDLPPPPLGWRYERAFGPAPGTGVESFRVVRV